MSCDDQRLLGNIVVRRRRRRHETMNVSIGRERLPLRRRPWMIPAAFAGVIAMRAMTITLVGSVLQSAGAWLHGLTDDHVEFLRLLFEVMSGLANVGWSQDVTWGLAHPGPRSWPP